MRAVTPKSNRWAALGLMAILIASRWPGLMPPNFSAAYGLMFCAGVYLPGRAGWWLPLGTMLLADVGLGFYYWRVAGVGFQWYPLVNYAVYGVLIAFGRRFKPSAAWLRLVGGGLAGTLLFYLVTNTVAWLLNPFGNPEYTRDLQGWWIALTQGTAGQPPTWEFLRNTLLSGGLFTGLFAGAMKWADQMESAAEKAAANAENDDSEESGQEAEPEESRA
jgi:hypothetical protein